MIIYFAKENCRGSLRLYPKKMDIKCESSAIPENIRSTYLDIIGDQGERMTISGGVDELVNFIDVLNKAKEKLMREADE